MKKEKNKILSTSCSERLYKLILARAEYLRLKPSELILQLLRIDLLRGKKSPLIVPLIQEDEIERIHNSNHAIERPSDEELNKLLISRDWKTISTKSTSYSPPNC